MTLNDIELAVYRRTGYADTPATEVVVRIRQWINIWHQRLCARPGIELLRDATVTTLISVPGQAQYPLQSAIRRVQHIVDPTTPVTLAQVSLLWIREHDPGLQAVGIPEAWAPVSWYPTIAPAPVVPYFSLTIQLWPKPTGVVTYTVDGQMILGELGLPADMPFLPYEYHWLLVEAACYEEWMRKADTRSGTARQDLETGMKELRHWLSNTQDYRPTNRTTHPSRSRLGGMYPSW